MDFLLVLIELVLLGVTV